MNLCACYAATPRARVLQPHCSIIIFHLTGSENKPLINGCGFRPNFAQPSLLLFYKSSDIGLCNDMKVPIDKLYTCVKQVHHKLCSVICFITAYTCNLLPQIANGVISYSPNSTNPFDYGTIATYLCNEGFYIYSTDLLMRSCSGSGTVQGFWSGQEPQCLGKLNM